MPEMTSLAESLALLNESEWQTTIRDLSPEEANTLLWDWDFWARPEQKTPLCEFFCWLILAGRGWGKTRTGAEQVCAWARSGEGRNMALIAETAADARDVMVEGGEDGSGILRISPPWFYPSYEPSKRRLTWPNGAQAHTYSGDDPNQLRGPQHDKVWADEPAKWRYAQEAWDNMEFGLRVGDNPQVVATTTPRPIPLIRMLLSDPKTVVTRGSSYDNVANLAPSFITRVLSKYEGTRLGRQELYAEVLDDVEGALWQRDQIDALRVREAPELLRIVVGVDPAVTSGKDADETGIVAVGLGRNGHAYVLADESCRESPDTWARRAVNLYYRLQADRIVAEVNNGGDLVEAVIRTVDRSVPYTAVHAARGKVTRAEPVGALYEQGRVHHVGMFAALEDQQCAFVPGAMPKSPDRVDALVWAFAELGLADWSEDSGLMTGSRKRESTGMPS